MVGARRERPEPVTLPLSILDLATIGPGETTAQSLQGSVALAQVAETHGYRRVWYAEHHNMPRIASSATSVLIAHVASRTTTIRLGSGGIMLPNHAPLTIAEQFGTLETLHPGRIDLGLGRAPGTDQKTLRALRRDPHAADAFPEDVQELRGYLAGKSLIPGVDATPGKGTEVPLYILGSSLFGARLAAALGLPYAFASHFAPDALRDAVAVYRSEFRPSAQLDRPYVIAAANVIAADTEAEAQQQFLTLKRQWVRTLLGRGRSYTDEEADQILASPQGRLVHHNLQYTALGAPAAVREYLAGFAAHADADELIVAHQTTSVADRLRSARLTAEAMELRSPGTLHPAH
ncbi:LLM class flavin-dependent oxidoreductase [Nonomuraea indica]|uniref:LLM class flavin-dependent oxidoreductase n=1 Tax=Nonomuraea indica TaxID=1581193 RepID=A0ABW8A1K1_9ACTN